MIKLNHIATDSIYHARKIKSNARRRLNGKARRDAGQRLGRVNTQDFHPTLNTGRQGLYRILRLRQERCKCQAGKSNFLGHFHIHRALASHIFGLNHLFTSSCNCNAEVRSIHSPAAS
ncbi:hypothetical protein FQZ97_996950 [compost metagenome]